MDFILSYNNNEETMVFPAIVNGSVELERAQDNPTFDGLTGQLQALGTMQLAAFSVESVFPTRPYRWMRPGSWADGWRYVETIEAVRRRRIPFRAIYLDGSGREVFNLPVSVESFAYGLDEAGDISYRLAFREYRFAKTPEVESLKSRPAPQSFLQKKLAAVVTERQEAARKGDGYTKLYTLADAAMLARVLYSAARGVKSMTATACVAWTALNRLDSGKYGRSLYAVLCAPEQFTFRADAPTRSDTGHDLTALATDVLDRWSREKAGQTAVGRVLPPDYLWFAGDGGSVYFRNQLSGGTRWDYSLPSPYGT